MKKAIITAIAKYSYLVHFCILLVICLNIGLKYEFFAGTLKTGLFLTVLVDFCVMGFFYRQKYGRRIFDELSDEQNDWDWDNKHKTYNKKTPEELQIKKISKKINKEIINQKLEQKKSEILSNIEKKISYYQKRIKLSNIRIIYTQPNIFKIGGEYNYINHLRVFFIYKLKKASWKTHNKYYFHFLKILIF